MAHREGERHRELRRLGEQATGAEGDARVYEEKGCRIEAGRSSLALRVAKQCDLGQRPEATGWLAQAEVPREGLAGKKECESSQRPEMARPRMHLILVL